VCSQEWPDPAFDRMYKQVHRALDQATVEYVEEHHLDGDASCWSEAEYCDIVHGLLSHCAPKPLIRHLAVRMTFGKPPEVPFEGDPYFFEVTYAQGRVTATLKTAAPVSMVFNWEVDDAQFRKCHHGSVFQLSFNRNSIKPIPYCLGTPNQPQVTLFPRSFLENRGSCEYSCPGFAKVAHQGEVFKLTQHQ
jgi:hypothetical protein